MSLDSMKVALVGPTPPPAGGMASQTRQLDELLRCEGAEVTLIQVNAPYRPRWIAGVRGIRAVFRLLPYIRRLWRIAGQVHLFHIMANSGWSWHLYAAPAIGVARIRGVPAVVNYRGGEAEAFLARSGALVRGTMRYASAVTVPSGFLQEVFRRYGIRSEIVPNIIDVERFRPGIHADFAAEPRLIVARNLELIYDIPTALRAFRLVRQAVPGARLTVAGSGPEEHVLASLANELGIAGAVHFCGRMDRDEMAALYRSAAIVLNPSRVDNMPNSVLEAMASGVPVVSTRVGGVPFILRDGETGLMVPAGDAQAMASAVLRILTDATLAKRLRDAALSDVQQYTWSRVRQRWIAIYAAVLARVPAQVRPA